MIRSLSNCYLVPLGPFLVVLGHRIPFWDTGEARWTWSLYGFKGDLLGILDEDQHEAALLGPRNQIPKFEPSTGGVEQPGA